MNETSPDLDQFMDDATVPSKTIAEEMAEEIAERIRSSRSSRLPNLSEQELDNHD
jgi:hypothetical protein